MILCRCTIPSAAATATPIAGIQTGQTTSTCLHLICSSLCLLEQTACQRAEEISPVHSGRCRTNSTVWGDGQEEYEYPEDSMLDTTESSSECPTRCNKVPS